MSLILAVLLGAQPAPAIASRTPSATTVYFLCVRDRSLDFARGRESAEAIGEAVVVACNPLEQPWRSETIAYFATQGLGGALAEDAIRTQLLPELRARARREAMLWVIEARLPAKPAKTK